MVICDVKFDTKYDQVLIKSSQEPPTSSKYDCVLDAFIIMLGGLKFEYFQEWQILLIHGVKFDIREDPILQNSSQEPSTSSE